MPHVMSQEQLINHVTANNQFSSGVAALQDGRLFFTYTSLTNNTFEFEDIWGRAATIGADGRLSFLDATILSEGDRGRQQHVQAWAGPFFSNPGNSDNFLLSYTDAVPIGITLTAPGTVIRTVQSVGQDGTLNMSAPFVLTSNAPASDFRVIASPGDAEAIVLFRQSPPSGSGSDINYIAQINLDAVTTTGFAIRNAIPLAQSIDVRGENEPDAARIAGLDGSVFLSVWANQSAGAPFSARVIGFDGSGAPVAGVETAFAATQGRGGRTTSVSLDDDIEIEALADGTLVAIYEQRVNSALLNTDEIAATVLTVNGDLSVSFGTTTLVGSFSGDSDLAALAMKDGRLLVAWHTAGVDGLDVYATLGTPDGAGGLIFETPFLVNDQTRNDQRDVSMTQLADGRVVFTYTSSDFGLGDFSGLSVVSRVMTLDPIPGVQRTGSDMNDTLSGGLGPDRLDGGLGNDTLYGGDGPDTLIGGEGDDLIFGGASAADLRDVIFGGAGNDRIDAGYGNDQVYGGDGNDTVEGGFGVDEIIGQGGDDVLTGSAFSDLIFGGDGDDFINGGFGSDRVNGGAGADRFYHLGIADHGSDWIQDYSSADGDVLVWGGGAATRAQFQVNTTETAGAGAAGVEEAFVIYRPTGQILWALVDGGAQGAINLQIGGQVFDLLA